MPGMPEILLGILGMNYLLLEPRLLAAWGEKVTEPQIMLIGHAKFSGMPGVPNSLTCPACQILWQAGRAINWVMPGMPKSVSGMLRVVTKISSCRVNTTSRRGNQTARDFFWFYFSSIFQ